MKTFQQFSDSKKKDKEALVDTSDKGVIEIPVKKADKRKKKEALADDLTGLQKQLNKIEKLKDGEFKIVNIVNVSVENPMDSPEFVKEANSSALVINADFSGKDIKRNDSIYITAMVRKTDFSANSFAVFKVRVIDIYSSLSILNSLK